MDLAQMVQGAKETFDDIHEDVSDEAASMVVGILHGLVANYQSKITEGLSLEEQDDRTRKMGARMLGDGAFDALGHTLVCDACRKDESAHKDFIVQIVAALVVGAHGVDDNNNDRWHGAEEV
jgi:hypothetical protein